MGRSSNEIFASSLSKRFLPGPAIAAQGDERHLSNVKALAKYFGSEGGAPFDGSRFESYGLRGHADDYAITAGDLVAVTLLSMEIRRESRSGIATSHVLALEDHAAEITGYLRYLPIDRDLHELSSAEFHRILGEGSHGRALWELLRRDIGMHRVAAFKLLARKRPRLCPIADSRTEQALGRQSDWWWAWHQALASSTALVTEIEAIRRDAAHEAPLAAGLSVLRVADIVLWNS